MLKHNTTEIGMFGSLLAHRCRVGGVTHCFLSISLKEDLDGYSRVVDCAAKVPRSKDVPVYKIGKFCPAPGGHHARIQEFSSYLGFFLTSTYFTVLQRGYNVFSFYSIESYNLPRFRLGVGDSKIFQGVPTFMGGGGVLIPIETYRTCDFPGGSGTLHGHIFRQFNISEQSWIHGRGSPKDYLCQNRFK